MAINPLIGASLISAGADLAGSFLGGSDGPDYGKQLESWFAQQQYNTPANQVARLRAAGLNPNLIYGNGSASTGNASSGPYHDVGERQGHHHNFVQALNAVSSAVGTYLDLKGKAQQQELDKLNTLASIQHSKDALEFEKRRFMVDQAFRDAELNLREREFGARSAHNDREYELAKNRFEWERNHVDTYGTKPGTTMDWFNRLLSGVAGKPTTDVSTDTSNLLNGLFSLAFRPVTMSMNGARSSAALARSFMRGFKGVRY